MEGNAAFAEREKRVILAHADILAGIDLGAALADDDVAADDDFATVRGDDTLQLVERDRQDGRVRNVPD